jgi:hypothetical protein
VNATRGWIMLLVAMVFLTGAAAGVLSERLSAERSEGGALEDYALLLELEFDLSSERMGYLRTLLATYAADTDKVVREHEAAYRAALEPDLRPLNEEYDRLVRDFVLPPKHRERFDELAAGLTLNPKAN